MGTRPVTHSQADRQAKDDGPTAAASPHVSGQGEGRITPEYSHITKPRCVFIGPGNWGRVLLPYVNSLFDIATVVSRGSSTAVAWTARHLPNVPHLTSVDDALMLPRLDAAFIATPAPSHPTLSTLALRAGCHVFVEKPFALRPADAAYATCIALKRHLEIFIGYVFLFHPAVELLRTMAPPQIIRSLQFDWVRPQLAGSPRHELLCHDLALTISLTDEVPDRLDVQQDDDETFRATMHLPSGRSCSVLLRSPTHGVKQKTVAVQCRDGSTHVWYRDVVMSRTELGTRIIRVAPADAIAREIAAFRAAIEGSGPRMIDDPRFSVAVAELL